METCWWKISGRMGRDQLTGGVELTDGDQLTGGGRFVWEGTSLLTWPTEADICN